MATLLELEPQDPVGSFSLRATRCAIDSERQAVRVQLTTPDEGPRVPVHLCCVVDLSASMDEHITLADADAPGSYLTILDIVKHALKTVVSVLSEEDTISLVGFSTTAWVVLPATRLDPVGRKQATDAIGSLVVQGATNLWAGLLLGFEQQASFSAARGRAAPAHGQATFVFTDGRANRKPAEGNVNALERLKNEGGAMGTVHTFGFGTKLDSEELYDLASLGRGSYSFISDEQLVGTIFVNAAASLLSTCATNVKLRGTFGSAVDTPVEGLYIDRCQRIVRPGAGWRIDAPPRSHADIEVDLYDARYGQDTSVMFSVPSQMDLGDLTLELSLETPAGTRALTFTGHDVEVDDASGETMSHYLRAASGRHFVQLASMGKHYWDKHRLDAFSQMITDLASTHAFLKELDKDWDMQVRMAVHNDKYFATWGRSYLRSIGMAHLQQRCNNFKDPGVQLYGGTMFRRLRDFANDQFNTIEPPCVRLPVAVAASAYLDEKKRLEREAADAEMRQEEEEERQRLADQTRLEDAAVRLQCWIRTLVAKKVKVKLAAKLRRKERQKRKKRKGAEQQRLERERLEQQRLEELQRQEEQHQRLEGASGPPSATDLGSAGRGQRTAYERS